VREMIADIPEALATAIAVSLFVGMIAVWAMVLQ
jgi:hypothetical protein